MARKAAASVSPSNPDATPHTVRKDPWTHRGEPQERGAVIGCTRISASDRRDDMGYFDTFKDAKEAAEANYESFITQVSEHNH
jgi:hypothetical protein